MERMFLPTTGYTLDFNERKIVIDMIDKYLDEGIEPTERYEGGVGRKVFMFDKYVIKVPKNKGKLFCGDYQNETERHIWFNSRHELLNEVYMEYRDCIVCKRVESNPDILLDKMGVSSMHEFEYSLREEHGNEIFKVVEGYGLEPKDIFSISNWGYDYDTNEFKCIDYGLRRR